MAEFYIRWATGLTWQLTLRTFVFTPEENYTRRPFFSYAFDFLIPFCRTSLFFLFAALLTATVCGLRRPKT